ncbi:MAG: AcrR family transcriptional regulator [Halioglobus sp.]
MICSYLILFLMGYFAFQGLEAFTIRELAMRSEVSIPTIHNLFGRKQDIALDLCEELVSMLLTYAADATPKFHQRLRAKLNELIGKS